MENCFYAIVHFVLLFVWSCDSFLWLLQSLLNMWDFLLLFKGGKETSFCVFCQFCSKFIAWCTCPCILSFLPLASLPRTRSAHSTCTLGSAWEIWNGYSNCSAWLDWDIDETADCPYPGSINNFWGILRIFIHLQDPPLCSHTCVCLCVNAFICASEICLFCVQYSLSLYVGGEPAGRVPSRNESPAWLSLSLVLREL